ncbi:hypothetical protein EYF80_003278 [Liparis tanakae]|uniref:Uncharacterized protein n=1 Tax=Liparis tanakae TaxID=230148 RepID=A0A4Z2JA11_9TELE|nr:hypothetical protein EYF80_003278 [Liparis tanakae]
MLTEECLPRVSCVNRALAVPPTCMRLKRATSLMGASEMMPYCSGFTIAGQMKQVTDKLVDQRYQLGFIVLHSRLHPLLVALGALLSEAFLLGGSEALRHLGRVDLQVVFVFHQQLHDGFVEGRGEEELGRVQALGEELEEDAEGTGSPSQKAPRVVALFQFELHQISQHLGVGEKDGPHQRKKHVMTSLLSLWISCFSDATYSRSCFRWWARVWMSGFTIFTSGDGLRKPRTPLHIFELLVLGPLVKVLAVFTKVILESIQLSERQVCGRHEEALESNLEEVVNCLRISKTQKENASPSGEIASFSNAGEGFVDPRILSAELQNMVLLVTAFCACQDAGGQTVASELEVNLPGFAEESPDQKEFSGPEGIPDLVAVAGLQAPGWP